MRNEESFIDGSIKIEIKNQVRNENKEMEKVKSTIDDQKKVILSVNENMLCGGIAGMASRIIIAPLDVVKIRFQVN